MIKAQNKLISEDIEKYGILFDLLRRSSNEEELLSSEITKILGDKEYKSLLDIGAGDGSITQRLMHKFRSITAIDKLDTNIYFLNSLGINTKNCDWESYETEEKFDCILASHIMYYFPLTSWSNEISRMTNLLNKNGKLILVLNSSEGEYASFFNKFQPKFHDSYSFEYSINGLVKDLKDKKLDIDHTTFESQLTFENKAHYLSLCKFLLDYDFENTHPMKSELEDYYQELNPLNNKERRYIPLLEDLLVVKKWTSQ